MAQGPNRITLDGPHTFVKIDYRTSRDDEYPDTVSLEELSEILAEATGESVEELEKGAAELDIAPPWVGS